MTRFICLPIPVDTPEQRERARQLLSELRRECAMVYRTFQPLSEQVLYPSAISADFDGAYLRASQEQDPEPAPETKRSEDLCRIG